MPNLRCYANTYYYYYYYYYYSQLQSLHFPKIATETATSHLQHWQKKMQRRTFKQETVSLTNWHYCCFTHNNIHTCNVSLTNFLIHLSFKDLRRNLLRPLKWYCTGQMSFPMPNKQCQQSAQ